VACAVSPEDEKREGINASQEMKLKSRASPGTEAERWEEAYRTIFPGEPVPSPCE